MILHDVVAWHGFLLFFCPKRPLKAVLGTEGRDPTDCANCDLADTYDAMFASGRRRTVGTVGLGFLEGGVGGALLLDVSSFVSDTSCSLLFLSDAVRLSIEPLSLPLGGIISFRNNDSVEKAANTLSNLSIGAAFMPTSIHIQRSSAHWVRTLFRQLYSTSELTGGCHSIVYMWNVYGQPEIYN